MKRWTRLSFPVRIFKLMRFSVHLHTFVFLMAIVVEMLVTNMYMILIKEHFQVLILRICDRESSSKGWKIIM